MYRIYNEDNRTRKIECVCKTREEAEKAIYEIAKAYVEKSRYCDVVSWRPSSDMPRKMPTYSEGVIRLRVWEYQGHYREFVLYGED